MKTTVQSINMSGFLRRTLILVCGLLVVLSLGLLFICWLLAGKPLISPVLLLVFLGSFLLVAALLPLLTIRYLTNALSRPLAHLIANVQLADRLNHKPPNILTRIVEIDILARSMRHMWAKILLRESVVMGNEKRLSLALLGSGEGVWDWDIQESLSYLDNNCCAILGVKPEEVAQDNRIWTRCLHEDDVELAKESFRRAATGDATSFEQEYRLKKDGLGLSWIQIRGSVVERDRYGMPARMSGTVSDVTERKHTEQQLKLYSTAFKCTKNAVLMLDKDFVVLAVNRAFCQITGQQEQMVVGQEYAFFHTDISPEKLREVIKSQVHSRMEWGGETVGYREGGSIYPQELAVYGVFDDHTNLTHYVAIFSDITERKRTEEGLRTLANYDPLTGLANRYMFNATLTRSLHSAKRKNEKLALLFIDLDHFKQVNDLLGHAAGDQLLIDVAARIQGNIRETDMAARLAGDEFVVILENIQTFSDVEQVALKILKALPGSGQAGALGVSDVSASIGVSLFPEHGDDLESLLRSADRAMYDAKNQGRNQMVFCSKPFVCQMVRDADASKLA